MKKLSSCEIKKLLNNEFNFLTISTVEEIGSTNTYLKESFKNNICTVNTFLAADSQTAGKGRMGRSFHSPEDSGLYMSLIIKPEIIPEQAVNITALTAVAVCEALENIGSEKLKIKWVNDIYNEKNKKVCGILCESVFGGDRTLDCIIVGVGINLVKSICDYPVEISNIADSVFTTADDNIKNIAAAEFLKCFFKYYENYKEKSFKTEYINRSCIVGKNVKVIANDVEKSGRAIKINDDLSLKVVFTDNIEQDISFGEISIKL